MKSIPAKTQSPQRTEKAKAKNASSLLPFYFFLATTGWRIFTSSSHNPNSTNSSPMFPPATRMSCVTDSMVFLRRCHLGVTRDLYCCLDISQVVVSGRVVHGWKFVQKSLREAVAGTMAGRLSNWSVEQGQSTRAGLGGALEVAIEHYLTGLAGSRRAAA